MRLFEAILNANHRAAAGDSGVGLHPSDFPDALPVVALTCIDPRLNRLLPEVLGVHEDDFIWLRNAGNIIFDPLSSMMRTLALACAIKGGKEIAVIGHTDCRVRQTSVNQLLESFRALGIGRSNLPDNLVEFFGLFASERQNVINGVEHIRRSPLISPKVPVHGLMVDIESGRLEWLVNGYQDLGKLPAAESPVLQKLEQVQEIIGQIQSFSTGDSKLPEIKIGAMTLDPQKWLSELHVMRQPVPEAIGHHASSIAPPSAGVSSPAPTAPPRLIPMPPPLRAGHPSSKSIGRQ